MTRLSLAVAAVRPLVSDIERFLAEVSRAGLGSDDELVIAVATDDPESLIGCVDAFAEAELLVYPADTTPIRLWGHAMAHARGTHIAILDLRDGLGANWCGSWAAAPRECLVCGPVDPEFIEDGCSWAAYMSEYGQFNHSLDSNRLEEVPGNNLVVPRELLPDAEDLEQNGFWKTFHLEGLKDRLGELPLVAANNMVVMYRRSYRLGPYLRRKLLHGRCYGGRRLKQPTSLQRLVYLGFTPALPVLRIYRVMRSVWKKRGIRRQLMTAGVPLFLGEVAWALGEALGYARGAGDACERLW